MKILQKIASLLILSILMSCGGGGGSSGPAPFSVRLDKTSINLTAEVGQTGVYDVVTAIASGSYAGQIYVGAVVEGVGIDPNSIGMTAQGANLYIYLQAASGLSAGTYTGRVLFYACSDYYCNHPIGGTPLAVNYTVLIKPGLVLAPSSMTFSAVEGASTAAQMLSWDTTLAATLPLINYTDGSGWLTITSAASGANVIASAAGLTPGVYRATIVETSQSGTAVSVPVTFTVGAGLITPSDNTIAVRVHTTATELQGVAPINAGGGVSAFSWIAASNASWLTLTRAAGMTGTNLTYQVDQTSLQSLTNFTDVTATVTVSPTGGATYTPVQFHVTVLKSLPEVSYVGPYAVVTGRASTVHVRGRGFSFIANSDLQTSGLTPSAVTGVNDTEMTMQVTPSSAGDYSISIANTLGSAVGSATLHAIAPQTYSYAAIPSGGGKRAIVFDPQRQSVYTVNVGTDALTRFRYTGGTWNTDALPISGILDVGMGPDGNSLIVTSTPGTLRLLDPVTLATQFSLNIPEGLLRNFTYVSQGISTSNNGRSWLTTVNPVNEFKYFDHQTRTLQTRAAQTSLPSLFYYGPWTAMARNGGRMLVVPAAVSPAEPMLYSDSFDSLLHTISVPLGSPVDMQMSEDGSRVLFDRYEVRDENFNLIGRTPIPAADASKYVAVAAAVSPNGARTYLLAYSSDALGSSPTTTILPRVYVFDSSTFDVSSPNLPLVGSFDLADYPTCRTYDYGCTWTARTTISPDGNTLFFAGDANLVVVPISPSYRTLSVSGTSSKALSSPATNVGNRPAAVRPWLINKK